MATCSTLSWQQHRYCLVFSKVQNVWDLRSNHYKMEKVGASTRLAEKVQVFFIYFFLVKQYFSYSKRWSLNSVLFRVLTELCQYYRVLMHVKSIGTQELIWVRDQTEYSLHKGRERDHVRSPRNVLKTIQSSVVVIIKERKMPKKYSWLLVLKSRCQYRFKGERYPSLVIAR